MGIVRARENVPLIQTHELGHKRLEMENDFLHGKLVQPSYPCGCHTYASHLYPVLIVCAPLDHIRFELVIAKRNQLPSERLNDRSRRDTMREQIVQLRAHLHDAGRRALLHDLLRNLSDERLPIRRRDGRILRDVLAVSSQYSFTPITPAPSHNSLLRMYRLEHQQRPPQIPTAFLRNPLIQPLILLPPLLPARHLQCLDHILLLRRRHPDQQRPTPNRRNDVARALRQQNQPQIRRILLHRPPQRRLRIAREMIRLVDDHDLEPLLGRQVHLLRLRDLLQQVLHDDAVVVAHVARRDLQVVVAGDDVELELAVGGRLEDAAVDLDLLHAGPVEFLERGHDAGFLAGARGPVDEEVGEVAALCLCEEWQMPLSVNDVL